MLESKDSSSDSPSLIWIVSVQSWVRSGDPLSVRGGVLGPGRWWESVLSLRGAAGDAPGVLILLSFPAVSADAVCRASLAAPNSAGRSKRGTSAVFAGVATDLPKHKRG